MCEAVDYTFSKLCMYTCTFQKQWLIMSDNSIWLKEFSFVYLHNDVIDGDVYKLDKESNETHNTESD